MYCKTTFSGNLRPKDKELIQYLVMLLPLRRICFDQCQIIHGKYPDTSDKMEFDLKCTMISSWESIANRETVFAKCCLNLPAYFLL